jgi:phosphatidylglycerophosphatase A
MTPRPPLVLASLFGAGYFPFASGTLASALTLAVVFWLRPYPLAYALVTLAICGVGVWAADAAERLLGEKDSHKIVIDEAAGMLLSAAYLPQAWWFPVAAFVCFRVLDVWKPFPARQAQALPGGWGVMTDDVIVAVYTNLLLQGLRLILPS